MQTVVYDRWYLAEIERRERRRRPAPPPVPRIDRREPDPRKALASAAHARGTSLAALSRMLERPSGYLTRFVRDGHPRALSAGEHDTLAAFFGVDARGLGERELWVPM
jgi:hypothetical protein